MASNPEQSTVAPPTHDSDWHDSPTVQGSPSSQSASCVQLQPLRSCRQPFCESQVSSVQAMASSQSFGGDSHDPISQVPRSVQMSPSSQGVPVRGG
jgi:hypothetical protein